VDEFVAGVVGCVVGVIAFLILSTLFIAGWAAVLGFILGSVFSWATYDSLKR
jgi:hypothetical protein